LQHSKDLMKQGNILDYLKVVVRNRMTLQFGMNDNDSPPNFDAILEDLPVYIRRAVIELQQVKLIPPRELSFISLDKKREAIKPDGSLRYNYYELPEDFASVEDFIVDGYLNQPKWSDNEFQIKNRSLIERASFFTITQTPNESGEVIHRLILEPFPEDDKTIFITYWSDGTDIDSPALKEKYWDAISSVVFRDLGLIDSYTANDQISSRVTQERHPQGNSTASGARPKTRINYFTKTSKVVRPPRL
jgi:hypothetical protein